MFKIENISKKYGMEYALQNVSMNIEQGMNFIIGASGSGKTTLLKILSGIEKNYEGEVTYLNKNLRTLTTEEEKSLYNREFGFVWQDFHLLEEATVLENILLPTYLKEESKEASQILKQVMLEDLANKKVRFLSGGQKQRVAIARELMKNPRVIFCDEPTSALDYKSAQTIMNILRAIGKKRTVIVVTHDTSLIHKNENVYEFDKGELIAKPTIQLITNENYSSDGTKLTLGNGFKIAWTNFKNNIARFSIAVLTLLVATTLIFTTQGNTLEESSQKEFDKLVETYGEGILDIGLVGSFMSAAGGSQDQQGGSVNQDLSGLFEKYQDDERVDYIVSMQPFENIEVTIGEYVYQIRKTGNSPVLTKLVAGSIPAGEEYQVVLPLKFVEYLGISSEEIIGTPIDFSATVFQWIDNYPYEMPVQIKATVCGVADNTVVYDYEGTTNSFTVDDSFFFNRAAIEEIRKQAGIQNKSANFTIRTKSPEALISLKDELNRSGIIPLGRFELVEDIVRLNHQTLQQTGNTSLIIKGLALVMVIIVFSLTSFSRKREYAIYTISGYGKKQMVGIVGLESVLCALFTILIMIIGAPILNAITQSVLGAALFSMQKINIECILVLVLSLVAYIAQGLPIITNDISILLKGGEKAWLN